MGLQEAVAGKVAEDSLSDGVLEALPELVGEGRGFVKAEASFWMGRILIRVILDLLEEPVHNAQVVVVVGIQARAEAMQEADRAHGGGRWGRGGGFSQRSPEGPEQDVENGAGGPGPVMEEGAEALRDRQHPLADGYVGEDAVHQMGCGLGHTLGPTRGTGASALA
jgi:hypothetical protein